MESYLWKPDDLDEIAAVLSPARREAVAQAEAEAVTDWPGIIGPVAEALLGEPTKRARDEWRYRTRGSLAVHVSGERAGTWRDWEADTGGGVLALVEHERGCDKAAALDWLESAGFVESRDPRAAREAHAPDLTPPFDSRACRYRPGPAGGACGAAMGACGAGNETVTTGGGIGLRSGGFEPSRSPPARVLI